MITVEGSNFQDLERDVHGLRNNGRKVVQRIEEMSVEFRFLTQYTTFLNISQKGIGLNYGIGVDWKENRSLARAKSIFEALERYCISEDNIETLKKERGVENSILAKNNESVRLEKVFPHLGESTTTGLAASKNGKKTNRHCIEELIERHILYKWWFKDLKGKTITEASKNHYISNNIRRLSHEIDFIEFEVETNYENSNNYRVIVARLRNNSFPFISLGFGCKQNKSEAIEKAVLEALMQWSTFIQNKNKLKNPENSSILDRASKMIQKDRRSEIDSKFKEAGNVADLEKMELNPIVVDITPSFMNREFYIRKALSTNLHDIVAEERFHPVI